MKAKKLHHRILCWVMTVAGLWAGKAHADSASSGLSLDPDENVEVVYAAFGGVADDKLSAHYTPVTDNVLSLLQKSPDGFLVSEDALIGKKGTDLVPSLLVIFNYDQQSYFYNIADGGGNLSLGKLASWAKDHRNAKIGNSIGTPTNDDFRIVFAAYGCGDKFNNVTDPVRKLIHDQSDGFIPDIVNMGGDPHPSWSKELVIVFDDSTGRHLYTMFDASGSHVSKATLLDSAKSN